MASSPRFTNACVAHLALNNLLAIANESGFEQRLLKMSRQQFLDWLDRIDREGATVES